MRTISLYTTLGRLIKIETDVQTWGQLKPLAEREGINVSDMKASESVNRTTLENDNAVLPEGDFIVFFTKIKSKAGSMSYGELRATIKELVADSDEAREHFNSGGRNYTNKTKADLENLLESWDSGMSTSEKPQSEFSPEASQNSLTVREILGALNEYLQTAASDFDSTEVFNDAVEFVLEEDSEALDNLFALGIARVETECEETLSEEEKEALEVKRLGQDLGLIS